MFIKQGVKGILHTVKRFNPFWPGHEILVLIANAKVPLINAHAAGLLSVVGNVSGYR